MDGQLIQENNGLGYSRGTTYWYSAISVIKKCRLGKYDGNFLNVNIREKQIGPPYPTLHYLNLIFVLYIILKDGPIGKSNYEKTGHPLKYV